MFNSLNDYNKYIFFSFCYKTEWWRTINKRNFTDCPYFKYSKMYLIASNIALDD